MLVAVSCRQCTATAVATLLTFRVVVALAAFVVAIAVLSANRVLTFSLYNAQFSFFCIRPQTKTTTTTSTEKRVNFHFVHAFAICLYPLAGRVVIDFCSSFCFAH